MTYDISLLTLRQNGVGVTRQALWNLRSGSIFFDAAFYKKGLQCCGRTSRPNTWSLHTVSQYRKRLEPPLSDDIIPCRTWIIHRSGHQPSSLSVATFDGKLGMYSRVPNTLNTYGNTRFLSSRCLKGCWSAVGDLECWLAGWLARYTCFQNAMLRKWSTLIVYKGTATVCFLVELGGI